MEHNSVRIKFSQQQSFRSAADAARVLLDAIQNHDKVVIDCDEITSVDMSFIQILISAHKYARDANKVIGLKNPAGGALLECLHAAGILVAVISGDQVAQLWKNGVDA